MVISARRSIFLIRLSLKFLIMIKIFLMPNAKFRTNFSANCVNPLVSRNYIFLDCNQKEKPYQNDRVGTFKTIGI